MKPDFSILVVDDEPFVLAVTVHVLKQLGLQQITTACNGEDALKVMQTSALPFDLIICDLNMPVMNGFDFMRAAQTVNYQGALIVLSSEESHALTSALELGSECGFTVLGALRKPLEHEQLRAMLVKYGALIPTDKLS